MVGLRPAHRAFERRQHRLDQRPRAIVQKLQPRHSRIIEPLSRSTLETRSRGNLSRRIKREQS